MLPSGAGSGRLPPRCHLAASPQPPWGHPLPTGVPCGAPARCSGSTPSSLQPWQASREDLGSPKLSVQGTVPLPASFAQVGSDSPQPACPSPVSAPTCIWHRGHQQWCCERACCSLQHHNRISSLFSYSHLATLYEHLCQAHIRKHSS